MFENLSNPLLWGVFLAVALLLIRSRIRDKRDQRNIQIAVEKALEEERRKQQSDNEYCSK